MNKLKVQLSNAQEDASRKKARLAQSVMTAAAVLDALVERGAPFTDEIEGLILTCVELVGVHGTNQLLKQRSVNAKLTMMCDIVLGEVAE